jgi:hypothetical protein
MRLRFSGLRVMIFATTAFMAAAQAQSSYDTPCARAVYKLHANDLNPKWIAMAMCNRCEDCVEYNRITASPGPSPRAQSAPRRR